MVDAAQLVVVEDGVERRESLTTIADAASFVGEELFPDGVPDDASALELDPVAAQRLGDLYGFAAAVLTRFRDGLPAEAAATAINLWPEHFDIALEAGDEASGQRANYGVSPGDEHHPDPYLYVGPWSGEAEGELWNASGFAGAELGYGELLESADPEAYAVEFFSARSEALAARG
jgi:hypothetical protein